MAVAATTRPRFWTTGTTWREKFERRALERVREAEAIVVYVVVRRRELGRSEGLVRGGKGCWGKGGARTGNPSRQKKEKTVRMERILLFHFERGSKGR